MTLPRTFNPDSWMLKMDGSLPSRIMPYLYLGNLNHAQNPEMLSLLGITRVLSIGEPIQWPQEDVQAWGPENLMFVDKVQDNGVDPLTAEIEKCHRQRACSNAAHCHVFLLATCVGLPGKHVKAGLCR